MAVLRSVLVACAVGLAGMLVSAVPARAGAPVTDIREIDNNTSSTVEVYYRQDQLDFKIAPGRQWPGTIWVPQVSNDSEAFNQVIIIIVPDRYDYYVFQDYTDPSQTIKYSLTRRYTGAVAVSGGTGAGRKILTINSDGTLSMTTTT